MIPNIRYYAKLELCNNGKKTPKYEITEQAGYYPPMEDLKGRNGKIAFNLMDKLKDGANVPSIRLQAKNSLNFTGLKEYFQNDQLSGVAYGYPPCTPTYSKKNKKNPLYNYRGDGFLFLIDTENTLTREDNTILPIQIELIVLEGAKILVSAYCKQLQMGGFDEAINVLRKQAKPYYNKM